MKCPRCQQENPPQAKFCLECGASFKPLNESGPPAASPTDLRRALSDALEQQAATSEILRVISSSPTDVQPVFDAIARSAVKLCDAKFCVVYRLDGKLLHLAAHDNFSADALALLRTVFPRRPDEVSHVGRAVRERTIVNLADVAGTGDAPPRSHRHIARLVGYRGFLAMPILREGQAIGCIALGRKQGATFPEAQVSLVRAFADQAAIAVENVRLSTELQARNHDLTEALDRQTATSEILRVISSSPTDVGPVFDAILRAAARLCEASFGGVYHYDGRDVRLVSHYKFPEAALEMLREILPHEPTNDGSVGRAILSRSVVHVTDLSDHEAPRGDVIFSRVQPHRSVVAVPMLREGMPLGAIALSRGESPFSDRHIILLQTFANQAVVAIENVRLFNELQARNSEIADKNQQLRPASRHKSEFLANMSHELRTPLNAILGFSEVLGERMFGEVNEKQEEYLKDIHASGQHLLSLINDILDLSKIEAGRMELEPTDFSLPATLDNALILVRERAGRHGIALHMTVDERLGLVRADERKIRQVVLNLLSNAIKFTPEGGRIGVRATPGDGVVEVLVSDTGVGIAPEDQEAIFEEFRQVGTAAKKVEGTGLGLALSRKFVELHGGRIWVQSQVGVGSTFTFTIPVRRGE